MTQQPENEASAAGSAIIALMNQVVYRETHEKQWLALYRYGAAVRDHFSQIGIDVIVDDVEGYAYLRSKEFSDDDAALPRLIQRRRLPLQTSILLVALRKRLLEFETGGGDGQLVLTLEQIVDIMQVFQPAGMDEAKLRTATLRAVNRAKELGFLRELEKQKNSWEVRRIIKAYVDAQVLEDFAEKLGAYAEEWSELDV
ncbi:MAG: DUF4194 domain-containing protein [Ancrocorticia sp.]